MSARVESGRIFGHGSTPSDALVDSPGSQRTTSSLRISVSKRFRFYVLVFLIEEDNR